MPYENPKQAAAAFLSIKREQGLAAARAFGRKHREDLSSAAKERRTEPMPGYRPRASQPARKGI